MKSKFYNIKMPKLEDQKPEEVVTPEQVGKFIGIYILGPLLFMVCWNGVIPYLFAIKGINYLHSINFDENKHEKSNNCKWINIL